MASERIVDRLDSVFDLRIRKALNLSESVSTRVRLTYPPFLNSCLRSGFELHYMV